MIKVMIVDDHEVVREGLKAVLYRSPEVKVVGEAKDYASLLSNLKTQPVDIVVIDISLPGKSGIEIIRELQSAYRKVKFLVLSMHPEERFAVRALRSGASGYVNKQMTSEELLNAIKAIHKGDKYVSPKLAAKLVEEIQRDFKKLPHELLSDREYEIFRLIADGKTSSEIADVLNLSINTITTYRSRILQKMNVSSSSELTRYALENNLLD
jgi:DNA-binding NarL/FixJ family response regulator